MALTALDKKILGALEDGLPICQKPYAQIAETIGMAEDALLVRLQDLLSDGTLKRMGLVVRHHELGYNSNAMVVWDIEDSLVEEIARNISAEPFVTLCYQRPRRLPDWPYNLFCMIHGRERKDVIAQKEDMVKRLALENIRSEVLFSKRRFKQTGAKYCGAVA